MVGEKVRRNLTIVQKKYEKQVELPATAQQQSTMA